MAGITQGGYIASIIDAGAGTGAHKSTNGKPCVTISLDIKFIGATVLGDEIIGFTKIQKSYSIKQNDAILHVTIIRNGPEAESFDAVEVFNKKMNEYEQIEKEKAA